MTAPDGQLAPPGGWIETAPRIAPLPVARLGAPLRALLWVSGKRAKKRTGFAAVPQVILLLMRHRRLFWPWLRFASRLMPYGSLDRRDTELAILRVAWNCRCRYEWGQHVGIALHAGVPAASIRRIALGPGADGWEPRQVALLQAADELHETRVIAAPTWQQLASHFKERQLLEIAMLIGHYEMLAGVLNSVGLALEPQTEAQLAAAPIHAADPVGTR